MTGAGAARQVVAWCRRLWERGLIAGVDGNVSVRLSADRVLVTPSGLPKADLRVPDLVEVTASGRVVRGRRRPTSELDLHLRIYRAAPGARAVVHAHPPTATGFAAAGRPVPTDILPETAVLLGDVPLVPYATPGTPALGDRVEPMVAGRVALLLANHGAVTWGATLAEAGTRMECLEHAARIVAAAEAVGTPRRLGAGEVAALRARSVTAAPDAPRPRGRRP